MNLLYSYSFVNQYKTNIIPNQTTIKVTKKILKILSSTESLKYA